MGKWCRRDGASQAGIEPAPNFRSGALSWRATAPVVDAITCDFRPIEVLAHGIRKRKWMMETGRSKCYRILVEFFLSQAA